MTSVKPLVGVPPALLLVYSLLLIFYYYLSLKSYQEYFAFCAIFILSCCLLPATLAIDYWLDYSRGEVVRWLLGLLVGAG